jgi:hypothetical protein
VPSHLQKLSCLSFSSRTMASDQTLAVSHLIIGKRPLYEPLSALFPTENVLDFIGEDAILKAAANLTADGRFFDLLPDFLGLTLEQFLGG